MPQVVKTNENKYFEKAHQNIAYNSTTYNIVIPISNQRSDKELAFSIGNEFSSYHAILCGKTGSGKSVLLHQIIINGAIKYHYNELEFVLLDLKDGVEFQYYTDLPHVRVLAIDEDPEFGFQTLKWLDEEYKRRSSLFKGKGVKNIEEYKEAGEELARMLIVIDEFQKMFTYQGIEREAAALIENFVRQMRSVGMHLLLSTQTPNSVNWKDTTLEQIAIRMGPAMSKESEESLFRHSGNLIAANYTEKGKAMYNSHSGIASETVEFKFDNINPKDYLELFSAYYNTALETGWLDDRVIYRKTDNLLIDKNTLTFSSKEINKIVEPVIGYEANVSRKDSKVLLFDERDRTSNLLLVGIGDEPRQFKADILFTVINSFIENSTQDAKSYVYSETSFLKSEKLNQIENLHKSNKIEELHSWVNLIYEEVKNKNEIRTLLIIDGVDIINELTEIDDDNKPNDDWGQAENIGALQKLKFIIQKGKTKNKSTVVCSEQKRSVLDVLGNSIAEDFSYALALKGGDNRVNESEWENHELEENIGLLNNVKEKKSNKINLIKIQ